MKKILTNHIILYLYPILGVVLIPIANHNLSQQLRTASQAPAAFFLYGVCVSLFLFLFCWFLYQLSFKKVTFHVYSVVIASIATILLVIAPLQRSVSVLFWRMFYSDAQYHLLLAFMVLSVYAIILAAQRRGSTG